MHREVENAGYRIGSRGTILSKSGKPMKHCKAGTGHYQVNCMINGKVKKYYVHRLVASKFVPNPYGLPRVNHKDGNTANNEATNLEWVDARQNWLHAMGYDNYMTITEQEIRNKRLERKRAYNQWYWKNKSPHNKRLSNTLDNLSYS